ncbi:hypothetical protein ACFLTO_04145 [Chloroflexota bacterium]
MSVELGKIEKPPVEEFKTGRKLCYVPLIYGSKNLPADYLKLYNKYWKQVDGQISGLESKLRPTNRIYHEFISSIGKNGLKVLKSLNQKSFEIVRKRIGKGAQLEAIEDGELLTEFMDWNRCLMIGLQNHKVLERVYNFYTEATDRRKEFISNHIDETLKADEIGILFMKEDNQIKFPAGVEIFYVSPPALDEIKRWLKNQETQQLEKDKDQEGKVEAATN